ncbi:hypothetical protein Tsubulata_033817 [Turnera subulata]|uniref:F-box domain-containing protein n=1 Tax=Turnera subulata TaxID=218843 RepID=A0A9Q0JBR7_9ROSI|nr:hypothetical protein Tsubulata_033817 [Turnera subulata]
MNKRSNASHSQWSDLPIDLLDKIAGCLETQSDLGRFRSVCRGWRRSAPAPSHLKASRVLRLPWLPICDEFDEPDYFGLKEFTVYSIEPLPSSTHNDDTPSAAATRPWIVMLRFTKPGTAHLRDLADLSRVRKVDEGLPKVLDLRDYQVREICTTYRLCIRENYRDPCAFSGEYFDFECFRETEGGFMGLVLEYGGGLYAWKMGGKEWTEISVTLEEDFHSYIVGYHKGKFFVVSKTGWTLTVDPISLETKEVAHEMQQHRVLLHRYLVGSSEDLFLVEREYVDDEVSCGYEFSVSKLDEHKGVWVLEEGELKDHVLFIAYNNWSALVPAKHLPGYLRNCVYFADYDLSGCCDHPSSYFQVAEIRGGLQEGWQLCPRTKCSKLFWPPPTWLKKS